MVLLSGQRTKNGRPHELPLSRQALRDPARVPRAAALPVHLRPARPGAVLRLERSARRRLDARIAEQQGAPLAPWTVHDIRRTFATLAAEHGLIEPFT